MRANLITAVCNIVAAAALLGAILNFIFADDKATGLAIAIGAVLLARLLVLDVEIALDAQRRSE